MGFIKKKKDVKKDVKKVGEKKLPILELELVMHNSTNVTATEDSVFCYAMFQTERKLAPADWQLIAENARAGHKFVLQIREGVIDEDKDDN